MSETADLAPEPLLPDGVYINLKESTYFKQQRLGSSDLKDLFKNPVNWHAGSIYNPYRKPRKWILGNDRDYGHGFHYLLLEGEATYRERCEVSPFENFTSNAAKDWRNQMHLDSRVILTEEMDRQIRYMCLLVANHPQLAEAMAAGLSEVAIFWTDERGRRRRAKFDKLLPGYIVDPKSFSAAHKGADDHDRCLRIVANLSYDVQRFDYDVARERMIEFIQQGKVFGATDEQFRWLQQFPEADAERLADRMVTYPDGHPDQQSAWSWLWLFMQKPSDTKAHGAVLLPLERPRFDLTWRTGQQKVARALDNYDHFVRRFGLGDQPNEDGEVAVPWAAIHPLWRPNDEEFPHWLGEISSREHTGSGVDQEEDDQ